MKDSIMCGSNGYISSCNLEGIMRILKVLLSYQYRRHSLRIYVWIVSDNLWSYSSVLSTANDVWSWQIVWDLNSHKPWYFHTLHAILSKWVLIVSWRNRFSGFASILMFYLFKKFEMRLSWGFDDNTESRIPNFLGEAWAVNTKSLLLIPQNTSISPSWVDFIWPLQYHAGIWYKSIRGG